MISSFWDNLPRPFFALAPMEAVTDVVFRRVVAVAAPPDAWFSEFTNATGWAAAGERAIGQRLVKGDEESPLVAQLWGTDPAAMAQLAHQCAAWGYHGLDLNTGCPDSHAIRSGGGAALTNNPALTAELITALKTAGLPVSVKCRLGYSRVDEWEGWLSHLLSQDIAALTIHLRTKKEMSKVPAHWDLMPRIVTLRDSIAPGTLIIGNGDVRDRAHGLELATQTGCDGIMIGRGVFANPYCFEPAVQPHSHSELLGLLHHHLDLYDTAVQQHGPRPFDPLKRFFKVYIRDFDGASDLRASLMLTRSTAETRQLLNEYKRDITMTAPATLASAHYYAGHTRQPIRAIVFDSDGTLLDTRSLIIGGYQEVLSRHGLNALADTEYIRAHLGQPVPETYRHILGDQAGHYDISALAAEHDEVQNQLTHLIKPYPHAGRLLREWKALNIKLCLFTSGNRMMIRRNFAAAGLSDVETLFDAIVTADDQLPRKPEPDAIRHLLEVVSVAPDEAIVVGDHPYDITSGSRANVQLTVGISHGLGSHAELQAAGAGAITDSLEGVVPLTASTPRDKLAPKLSRSTDFP